MHGPASLIEPCGLLLRENLPPIFLLTGDHLNRDGDQSDDNLDVVLIGT